MKLTSGAFWRMVAAACALALVAEGVGLALVAIGLTRARRGLGVASKELRRLQERVPRPSAASLRALENERDELEYLVSELGAELNQDSFSHEMLEASGFCALAQAAIERFRGHADRAGVEIAESMEVGFARYASGGAVPDAAHVARLSRQLGAIDCLAAALMDAGVCSIDALERERFEGAAEKLGPRAGPRRAQPSEEVAPEGGGACDERISVTFTTREAELWRVLDEIAAAPRLLEISEFKHRAQSEISNFTARSDPTASEMGDYVLVGEKALTRPERMIAGDELISVSLVVVAPMMDADRERLSGAGALGIAELEIALKRAAAPRAAALGIAELEIALKRAAAPRAAEGATPRLFSSEPRVVAVGCGCPIPYDAEICPFTGARQPKLNQLDRDGDGVTDDWELKYGFDRYAAADAQEDPDGDQFTNLEEFRGGTDPWNRAARPGYAEKLRFVRRKEIPFPLVFKGYSVLADGHVIFQLYIPKKNETRFAGLGDEVEGVVLKRFIEGEIGGVPRLFVQRGAVEIELSRGAVADDPQCKAELINMLDRSTIIVTMGPLLSLCSDEYAVLGVETNKVSLRDVRTGKVFDIVGLAEEERSRFSEDLE